MFNQTTNFKTLFLQVCFFFQEQTFLKIPTREKKVQDNVAAKKKQKNEKIVPGKKKSENNTKIIGKKFLNLPIIANYSQNILSRFDVTLLFN